MEQREDDLKRHQQTASDPLADQRELGAGFRFLVTAPVFAAASPAGKTSSVNHPVLLSAREQFMSQTETNIEHTIDSILEQLDRFHQRATYGAVAGVVDSSPRSLMAGRARDPKSSWIVSRKDGLPTGYETDQTHPDIQARDQILGNPESLRSWLANPS